MRNESMNRRAHFLLLVLFVPILAGCGGVPGLGKPRTQGTTASGAATTALRGGAREYVEVEYVKLLAGSADELADKYVRVRCQFVSVDPSALPPGYSSAGYLGVRIIGQNFRPSTPTGIIVPKRLAESVLSLSGISDDKIVVYGRVVAVPLSGWRNLPGGRAGRAVQLVLEAHKIERDTSSAEAEQDQRAQTRETLEQLSRTRQVPQEPRADTHATNQSPPTTPLMAAPQVGGLNGKFTGQLTGTAGGQAFSWPVTFTLVQVGDRVAGIWTSAGGIAGTVSGTVQGIVISEFRAKQADPCQGDSTGSAVIENDGLRLRGSYAGGDCSGPTTASFEVNRQ